MNEIEWTEVTVLEDAERHFIATVPDGRLHERWEPFPDVPEWQPGGWRVEFRHRDHYTLAASPLIPVAMLLVAVAMLLLAVSR